MLNNTKVFCSDFWVSLKKLSKNININHLRNNILILVFFKYISLKNKVDSQFEIKVDYQFDFPALLTFTDFLELNFQITNRLYNISLKNPVLNGILDFVDFKSNSNNFGSIEYEFNFLRDLLILIDKFAVSLDGSNEDNRNIWGDLFSHILISFENESDFSPASFSAPDGINNLISRLIVIKDDKNFTVNSPRCKTGNLFLLISKNLIHKPYFFAEDNNRNNVFLTKINLIVNGISTFKIEKNDVFNNLVFLDHNNDIQKFDYVLDNFPLKKALWNFQKGFDKYNRWNVATGIPPFDNPFHAYLLHIIKSLKVNGTAVLVVKNDNLYGGTATERNIRKYVLENGYFKGIIELPHNLYESDSCPTSIIILQNESKSVKKDVFMINATSGFESSRFSFCNILSIKNIDCIIDRWYDQKEIADFSLLIPCDEIAQNDYNLNVSRYIDNSDDKKIPQGSKMIELSSILKSAPEAKANNNLGKLIKISDLSTDSFLYDIDLDSLESGELKTGFFKLEMSSLLISTVINNLKPSYCYATKENPVLVSPEIEIFTIENESIDLSYLIMQLNSDFVLKQIEIYSQGIIMPRLKLQNIFKLKIIVPDMDLENSLIRQKALVEGAKIQSDKDKIETLQLQSTIDTLLKERMNDFQWNLHDIRNGELLNLVGKVGVLDLFADANPAAFNQIINSENNITTNSLINQISISLGNLAKFLDDLYNTSDDIVKKEDLDILNFIEYFCDKQSNSRGDLFQIDYSSVEKVKNDFEIFELIIWANKKDVERVFTNIFHNAVKHGGFENSNQINKIKFDISIYPNEQIVKIAILNNGRESEISSLNYFADGGKAGSTANTGKGGHIIKILTERNNGKVFQNNYSIKEANGFTFEVGFQFKYK